MEPWIPPPRKLPKPHDPLVVFDLNAVQGWPQRRVVPDGFGILVPDALPRELLGRFRDNDLLPESKRRPQAELDVEARRVGYFFTSVQTRTWLGQDWTALARGEFSPMVVTKIQHVVDAEVSPACTGPAEHPPEAWPDLVREAFAAGDLESYDNERASFLEQVQQWTDWILSREGQAVRRLVNFPQEQIEWVTRPSQMEWVIAISPDRFAAPEWRDAFLQFPDRLAWARWARLILWYSLQRCMKPAVPPEKFANHCDDMHYAFLASYSGHLATSDGDLKAAVAAVFPHVRIWDPQKTDFKAPSFQP